MQHLNVISNLESTFNKRLLCNHAGERGIIWCGLNENKVAIVLDLSLSKKILASKSFRSFNYFEEGYRRPFRGKQAFGHVSRFFSNSPLFLEGSAHRSVKQKFNKLLKEQADQLEAMAPRISQYMKMRKRRLASPLDFAHGFVEICIGTIISHLMKIPLKTSLYVLRSRANVFYFHFHPIRHKSADDALALLAQRLQISQRLPDFDVRLLLCQSLILMAYDPLVATICANLVDGHGCEFKGSTERYCAVSFVSRYCEEQSVVDQISFNNGDVCYVSLLPAADETVAENFPFGTGHHICVGRRISLQILELAGKIVATDFADGFDKNPVVSPDGAFLSFQD